MKIATILIALLINCAVFSQQPISPTDSLIVTGKIKSPAVFRLADLDTFRTAAIKDLVIYNHKGEAKNTLTGIRGIPLKSLLASIEFIYENPKKLNEFYFVFTASDGYKVVFSWNEIYNTEVGDNFFVVTEMGGKKLREMEQRIIFISTADLKTGRRYIKGLSKIEVKQIE